MAVWVDGSLPSDYFEVSWNRSVMYCVGCLKDEKAESLTDCKRCGGRLHAECLQRSHGRNRICPDCVRALFLCLLRAAVRACVCVCVCVCVRACVRTQCGAVPVATGDRVGADLARGSVARAAALR